MKEGGLLITKLLSSNGHPAASSLSALLLAVLFERNGLRPQARCC